MFKAALRNPILSVAKSTFLTNLIRVAGFPNLNLEKGIHDEHCEKTGFNLQFETTNYGNITTPSEEYHYATGQALPPDEAMLDRSGARVRVIRPLAELMSLKVVVKAMLTAEEVLTVVSPFYLTWAARTVTLTVCFGRCCILARCSRYQHS